MLRSAVTNVILRELGAVRRSVEAYPDDVSPWVEHPGMPNSGGNLALHVAGNLRHFVGLTLGQVAYVRDRDSEFSRRAGTRADLVAGLDAARAAVERGMAAVSDGMLAEPYPEKVGGRQLSTGDFLVHLAVHLAYHLGQLDYHRRAVTGERQGVGALATSELGVWDGTGRP
ncbi:MAG: DinB family protein [Candidatus Eisenbacteria bacterium]